MSTTWIAGFSPALTGLLVTGLLIAAVDALFETGAEGLRLVCGLSMALCVARLVAAMLLR